MLRPLSHYLIATYLILFAAQTSAAEWKVVIEKSGITVQQQDTPSGYATTRASKEIQAPLPVLAIILRDPTICKDLIHFCRTGRLVTQYDKANRLDYVVIDAPLLFDDRDLYVHSYASWDANSQTVLIKLAGRENHDEGQPGRVRIKDFQGFWRLQRLATNRIAVTYQTYSNPQIPGASFVNLSLADSVLQTLLNLEKLSKKPEYQTQLGIEALAAGE